MQIKSIKIHNFRSLKEVEFNLYKYSILVGANNAGKTNFMTVLRIFYDDIKFNDGIDFPKFKTEDKESWIDIEYVLTDEEFKNLREEYKNPNNVLKVRKFLKSEDEDRVKSKQSNIYGYENGSLSENLFYGAKNIGQTRLGSVLFIPEVTKINDTLKLSGPSPLKEIVTFIMKKVVKNSNSFRNLNITFEDFNEKFKDEASKDGFSLNNLKENINSSLKEWQVEFNFNINPIEPDQIIKYLISHYVIDNSLGKKVDIINLGQGLQRHIIYTLLKISSDYTEEKEYTKKEFSPDFNLILFEEPEAFLHPSQQEFLNNSLKSLSCKKGTQIIASTHSPFFLSKNIEDIPNIVRLERKNGITSAFQVSEKTIEIIISENNELAQMFETKFKDPDVEDSIKTKIKKKFLIDTNNIKRLEEESMRYLLWLDSERCCGFFADSVLICEGASEKALIEHLLKNKWDRLRKERIYVLDVMGKFNIHRFMNLFKELGIFHSVLADKDNNDVIQGYINDFIIQQKNTFTKGIDFFAVDIEDFLGIKRPPKNRGDKKPLNIMWNYHKGKIPEAKIDELENKIKNLI